MAIPIESKKKFASSNPTRRLCVMERMSKMRSIRNTPSHLRWKRLNQKEGRIRVSQPGLTLAFHRQPNAVKVKVGFSFVWESRAFFFLSLSLSLSPHLRVINTPHRSAGGTGLVNQKKKEKRKKKSDRRTAGGGPTSMGSAKQNTITHRTNQERKFRHTKGGTKGNDGDTSEISTSLPPFRTSRWFSHFVFCSFFFTLSFPSC